MHFISIAALQKLVNNATSDSFEREALMHIFSFESYTKVYDGKSGYVISHAGTYKGLGQFDAYTWNALQPLGLEYPYSLAGNPTADVRATLLLLRDAGRYHRNKFGFEMKDVNTAYLFHNQGAPSAASFLRSGVLVYPKQSKKAREAFKEINRGPYA